VVATFAMGTALGDLTATTFGLGYFGSMIVFAAIIAVPAVGYRWLGWNSIFCFWFAYVATRPFAPHSPIGWEIRRRLEASASAPAPWHWCWR
jgi:uncharacterized membrane-anchored protein